MSKFISLIFLLVTFLSVHRTYGGSLPDLDTYYSYDTAGRAKEVRQVQRRIVGGVEKCDTASTVLTFDKVGRVIAEQSGKVTRTLTYDVRSWLRKTETKAPSGIRIFSESLMYEDGVTPLYCGRVSGYEWGRGTVSSTHRYDFTYNRRGNLIKAAYTSGESGTDFTAEYTYGLRGELKRLKRNGVTDSQPSGKRTYGLLDDITAEYEGNRPVGLTVESDAQVFSSRTGMRGTGDFSMSYDGSGRLVSDSHRGITSIEYDNSGYPVRIEFSSGEACSRVQDSEGRLIRKTLSSQTSSGKTVETERVYTGGGHILRNDTLEMTLFPGGYFTPDGKVYYYVQDYRGNNAGVVRSTGTMSQAMDYYPYGEPFSEWNWELAGSSVGVSNNRYLFCGNERETSFGMNQNDFNARSYLASFPTFTQIDPFCEKYPWLSPYAYCGGDPINQSDPTGEDICILYDPGLVGHIAMLIQNEQGTWQYYSVNGDKMYSSTSRNGGLPYNNTGETVWESPEAFMAAEVSQNREEKEYGENVGKNFDYKEAYRIETTPEQDTKMREKFTEKASTQYWLLWNNCATAVQETMLEVDLPINSPEAAKSVEVTTSLGTVEVVTEYRNVDRSKSIFPGRTFKSIMQSNPCGKYMHK